jgi:hypothetical protein
MKRILILTAALLVALITGPAMAVETCDATGCTWTASWTEPSVDTAGNPLAGQGAYAKSTLYMQIGTGTITSVDVPASKPAGGGAISVTTQKAAVTPGTTATIKWWVKGTNVAGLQGASSNIITKTKDRTGEVPPAASTNLTVD